MGGEGCVLHDCIYVCPCGGCIWVWFCVYGQCPVIGSVNWYDGMEGSWFWCVAVCEGSVWTCGGDSCVEVAFDEGNG